MQGGPVFICYRRSESRDVAQRLYELLITALGRERAFMDVSDIHAGEVIPQSIASALQEADTVVVVIGPGWERARDGSGRNRIDDPDDFVRREVRHALASGARVVPLLHGRETLPAAADIPPELRGLLDRQAVTVRDASFVQDVEVIVRGASGEGLTLVVALTFLGAFAGTAAGRAINEATRNGADSDIGSAVGSGVYYGTLIAGVLLGLRRLSGLRPAGVASVVLLVAGGAAAVQFFRRQLELDGSPVGEAFGQMLLYGALAAPFLALTSRLARGWRARLEILAAVVAGSGIGGLISFTLRDWAESVDLQSIELGALRPLDPTVLMRAALYLCIMTGVIAMLWLRTGLNKASVARSLIVAALGFWLAECTGLALRNLLGQELSMWGLQAAVRWSMLVTVIVLASRRLHRTKPAVT